MSKQWAERELDQLFEFSSGKSIAPGGDGAYPVFGSNGLIGRADESLFGSGIIIGRVGAYCGSVVFSRTPFWASDNTIVARPKNVTDLAFGYYLLRNAKLNRHAGGSAQPLVTQAALKPLRFCVPPLPVQQHIAAMLGAYDDLMDVNRRRIVLLEQMARRLFDEWFVRFQFPGCEELSFVTSEIGKIPEGWQLVRLDEMYETSSGGTPSRKRPDYYGGRIRWVKTQELLDGPIFETEEHITEQGLANSSARVFPPHTVLVAMYGATIGQLGVLMCEAATNQACCAVFSASSWAYPYLTLHHYRQQLINLRAGAAQQNISQALIRGLKILRPPGELLNRFERAATPILLLSFKLHQQNATLVAQRDLLLPRLLSGELSVSTAERALEAAE